MSKTAHVALLSHNYHALRNTYNTGRHRSYIQVMLAVLFKTIPMDVELLCLFLHSLEHTFCRRSNIAISNRPVYLFIFVNKKLDGPYKPVLSRIANKTTVIYMFM